MNENLLPTELLSLDIPKGLSRSDHPDSEYQRDYDMIQLLFPSGDTLEEFARWQREVAFVVNVVMEKWTEGKIRNESSQKQYSNLKAQLTRYLEKKNNFVASR